MQFRRIKRLTITVVITVAFLGGIATVCHAENETLTVSEMWEIDGIDPAKNGTFVKEKALIIETLVNAAADFSLKQGLAQTWEMTGDTLWQFTLRPGVRFHNGSQLTAEIVVSSLKRAMAINPSIADPKVRNGLSRAINRQEIVQYILFGMGKPAAGGYEDSMLFANKALKPHPFNPEKAKQLFAEAGYSDSNGDGILDMDGHKLATTLYTYPQRPGLKPMAIAIQQQWRNVGVAVEVRVMDYAAIAETMKPGDVKLSAMASAMIPDPDYLMRRLYSKNGEFNTWGDSNPEVEALLAEGNKTVDPEKRLALYQKIQALVFEEMPIIPVSYYGVNVVTQRKVKGFVFNPVAHDYMLNTQMTLEP